MVYLSLDKAYIAAGESFKLSVTDATPDASSPTSYSYTITGEGVTTDHFVGETSLSGNIQLGVNNTGFKTFVTTRDFPTGDNSFDLLLSTGSTSVTLKVYSSSHYQTLNTKIDLTDTFDTWRKKTNSFVARLDSLESGTSDIKAQTLIGNGTSDAYVLNFQIVGANPYFFDINIDGITQNPFDAYTIDDTSNSIVFTDAPPADSVISILHKFAVGATFKEITEDFDMGGELRVGKGLVIDTLSTNVNVGTTLTDLGSRINQLEDETATVQTMTITAAGGTTDSYVLGFTVDTENPYFFHVNIDGITQNPADAYTITESSNTIVFSEAPPTDSVISIIHHSFTEITNDLSVAGDVFVTDKITHTGDENTSLRFPADDTVAIETAGVERLRVNSTGEIGIGKTATTGVELDVNGNIAASGSITGATLAGTLSTASQSNITSVGTLTSASISGDLTVDTSTLKVDSTNNRVGIGLTNPLTSLHIKDSIPEFRLEDQETGSRAGIQASDGNLEFYADDGATANNSNIVFQIDNIERMRINATGEVGIGKTATTGVELDVSGDIAASGNITGATPTVNTHLTTKSYVDAAVAGIVDGAPEALNTLNEIAEALNDSPGQIDNILTVVGQKLVIANNLSDLDNVTTARTNLGLGNVDNKSSATIISEIVDGDIPSTIARDSELTAHTDLTNNPHSVTATQVGLGNVTNESKTTMFTDPTFTGSITGTLGTASQPNITSVGTLTSLDITGDMTVATTGGMQGLSVATSTHTYKIGDINSELAGAHLSIISGGGGSPSTAIFQSCNVGIGKTPATSVELDVNGDIRASGTVTGATPTINGHLTTKAYVDTQVAGIVDSAPAALDTLNELAAALGDDASFATTTATSIGEKLAKASNLSDLADAATARTNLGLGTSSNVEFNQITGTLQTAAQTAITSVGTLTGLTVNGTTNVEELNCTDSFEFNGSGLFDNTVEFGDDVEFGGQIDVTGVATAATPTADTHLTTKAYVDTQVAGIVDSAPAALNTLNELAAALGDDASFATTTATSIGEKLAKASNLSDLANVTTAKTNLSLQNVTNESKTTMFTDPTFTGSITGTLGTANQNGITNVGTLANLTVGTSQNGAANFNTATFNVATNQLNLSSGGLSISEATGNCLLIHDGAAGTDFISANISTGKFHVTGDIESTGELKLSDYTSTSRSTGASALNPIQNYQPATDDTVTNLCVDSSGNVIRGSQEATWTFTRAQLNALATSRTNLLDSPGAGKCVVIEETNWLLEVDLTKAYQATNVNLKCEMLGVNANSVGTQMVKGNLNQIAEILKTANTDSIAAGGPSTSPFGLYHRDVPDLARVYRFDVPLTIRATNGDGVANNFPDNFVSLKLKVKYRVFDKDTF